LRKYWEKSPENETTLDQVRRNLIPNAVSYLSPNTTVAHLPNMLRILL